MSQQGKEAGQRGTEEETASLLQWSRGGLAGRITSGGEGDVRVMSVTDRVRRSSSPSSSSEQLDLQSSSAPQESAQQEGKGKRREKRGIGRKEEKKRRREEKNDDTIVILDFITFTRVTR